MGNTNPMEGEDIFKEALSLHLYGRTQEGIDKLQNLIQHGTVGKRVLGASYDLISTMSTRLGDFSNGEKYANMYLKFVMKYEKDPKERAIKIANCHFEQGKMFMQKNDLIKSLEELSVSERMYTENKSFLNVVRHVEIIKNIAEIYRQQKDYAMSIKTLEGGIKLEEDEKSRLFLLNRIGACYFSKNDFDKAEELHTKALKMSLKKPETVKGVIMSHLYLADVYIAMKNWTKAIESFQHVLEHRMDLNRDQEKTVTRKLRNIQSLLKNGHK